MPLAVAIIVATISAIVIILPTLLAGAMRSLHG
jgi:hypothetical protein